MQLSFIKRSDADKVDSREVASIIKANHSKWLHRVVLANQEKIESETAEILELEIIPSKRGKPVKIAWLTATQLLLVISLSPNTEESIELKAYVSREYAYLMHKRKSASNDLMQPLEWQERYEKTFTRRESPYLSREHVAKHFSPDKKFSKFLLEVESELGYITPWIDQENIEPFTYPQEYERYIAVYRELTEVAQQNDNGWIIDMWGSEPLPCLIDQMAPYTEKPHSCTVVWIDQPKKCQKLWNAFLEQIKNIVEVYEDPHRKEKYGIPTVAELEGGYDAGYVDWEPDTFSEPLEAILDASKAFERAYFPEIKILGFQAHKDWLEWMRSDEPIAVAMREFHLGDSEKLKFKTWVVKNENYLDYDDERMYKELHTSPGTVILRHVLWSDPFDYDCPEDPNAPLFEDARLYDLKYEPLFDWYLQNIWLPQHSFRYFQTIDPEGFPKLCQAMKALPANSTLPRTFVEAMKPQLTSTVSHLLNYVEASPDWVGNDSEECLEEINRIRP